MALTPEQIEALESQKDLAAASAQNAQNFANSIASAIERQRDTYAAFSGVYNNFDDILFWYDTEIRWLNGKQLQNPLEDSRIAVADPGNVGDGSIQNLDDSNAIPEIITLEAKDSTTFEVRGNISGIIGIATVGTPFNNDITFTIIAGITPFSTGDSFTLSSEFIDYINLINNRLFNDTADEDSDERLEPKRISQFDRGPKVVLTSDYETFSNFYSIPNDRYDKLQNGFGIITFHNSTELLPSTIIDSGTSSVIIRSLSSLTANLGDRLTLDESTEVSFIEITGFTEISTPELSVTLNSYTGTGDGTMTGISPGGGTVTETITVTATSSAQFSVVGSVTGPIGTADVGVTFISPQVEFLISAGATPFVAGDEFILDAINDPYYQYNMDFQFVSSPTFTYPDTTEVGQISSFSGFTDIERTNKTAADLRFQAAMNEWIGDLVVPLNGRLNAYNEQLDAWNNNPDQDKDPTAEISLNTIISALNIHLGTTPPSTIDVSDSGISDIQNATNTRLSFANSRESDIEAHIAAEGFEDSRYIATTALLSRLNGAGRSILLLTLQQKDAEKKAQRVAQLESRFDGLLP